MSSFIFTTLKEEVTFIFNDIGVAEFIKSFVSWNFGDDLSIQLEPAEYHHHFKETRRYHTIDKQIIG